MYIIYTILATNVLRFPMRNPNNLKVICYTQVLQKILAVCSAANGNMLLTKLDIKKP